MIASIITNADRLNETVNNDINSTYEISTESNFFGQPENQAQVALPEDYLADLTFGGYKFVSETDDLELYVKERNFNIAVYDKNSGYLWYSVYKDYPKFMMSGTSRYFVESGVVIEYYNKDNILVDDSKSYLSGPKFNVNCTFDYDVIENGLQAHLEFADLGILFDVLVRIEGDKLIVNLPIDSLEEHDIEQTILNIDGTTSTKVTQYRLKSVYLFPYFGANNYEINGYSFIPDGSGALIRYTDDRSSTAYTKRLYGQDEGVNKYSTNSSTYYLQDEMTASIPVFGVNHGYHQAAFLAVITEGDAFSEIHSYPYGYNSYEINTTFAKFIVRERYTIQTSSNDSDSFQLINEEPYGSDFTVEYHFLHGEDANYSGMARKYKNLLELDQISKSPEVNLVVIGMDYKNGLFGKNFVEMTSYDQLTDMVNELQEEGLTNINVVYFAWNNRGYYDNTPVTPRIASNLGGTSAFKEMMSSLGSSGVSISFYDNPMISFDQSLGSKVVKKITLAPFATNDVQSSLFETTYFTDPGNIADQILKYESFYSKYGIETFVFDTVGDNLFSYRYGGENYYRHMTIGVLQAELEALDAYDIGLYEPNAYLWNYIDSYYDAPIESNKYAYMTDSIPFIQLVLSCSVNMYSTYVNYVSDYHIMSMRLVEYNVLPSFLLTAESTHLLRYTNSEYIYTSQFDLWKETILDLSIDILNALDNVSQSQMLSHRYVDNGLAEVVYDNGTTIYVNYTNADINYNSLVIPAASYEVIRP